LRRLPSEGSPLEDLTHPNCPVPCLRTGRPRKWRTTPSGGSSFPVVFGVRPLEGLRRAGLFRREYDKGGCRVRRRQTKRRAV
jgi:hypothetical protein